MLKLEYLIFIDNVRIKCNDEKSFNHLLQSNSEIEVKNKKIVYKNISVDYIFTSGEIADTGKNYFHLVFNYDKIANIDDYVSLLKEIKTIIHVITDSPQILYDGISIYYSNLAYPIVSDIENVMRKLITKFMLTKVGIYWSKERTPEDVRSSINSSNKDLTYLHNIDFIQLKNFLFSENYPSHKDNLIKKLKEAKNISELILDDVKVLIPNSNWERYFFKNISITKESLMKIWDELYDLRCKIAHNKTFNKSNYERVIDLCGEIKPKLEQAISSLSEIKIDEQTREILEEEIANNFNVLYGEFISKWRLIEKYIVAEAILTEAAEPGKVRVRGFNSGLNLLLANSVINSRIYNKLKWLYILRSEILHNNRDLSEHEISEAINELSNVINELDIDSSELEFN